MGTTHYAFRDKNVLLFGLGLLGGGVATAKWLIKQGAKLTITDLKSEAELKSSLKQIKGNYTLSLGNHKLSDIKAADVVVVNPGVSAKHPLIRKAKHIVNEATIFYNNFPGKIVGVTGTRGKTTTATWTAHLLGKKAVLAGNNPEHAFLDVLNDVTRYTNYATRIAVTEVSSFHLELFDEIVRPPDIAVVTNIYRDHLNRYENMQEYAETKKNLYRWQKPGQILITGKENVLLDLDGFAETWGEHNLQNIRMAALAAHAEGISWEKIQERIASLPAIAFRQEIIFKNERLTIINDSAATSPEGGIAALERFGGPDTVLIAGGTDADLDFTQWNELVKKTIPKDHRIFLAGGVTKKMIPGIVFETLKECVESALKLQPKIILFSPACKSFEKFKNEYDRGRQFNALVKKMVK